MIDLRLGDVYNEIHKIPDNSVDLIIIDPPYDMSDFGGIASEGDLFNNPSMKKLAENADGLRSSFDYKILLNEFSRIQPVWNMYIFCNAKLLQKILAYLYSIEYTRVEILVYHKKNPLPSWKGHYMNDMEYCLYLCDDKNSQLDFGDDPYVNSSKLYQGYINDKHTTHPTEKPLALIAKLLKNSSKEGDLVLDCFSGSGTTAHACKILNRNFLGYEKNEEYYKESLARLNTQCQGCFEL